MPPTLAERLGFAPDDRIAIVHTDDIGMCHAANQGAFAALAAGPATCGSIMVPCPWFEEAAQHAADHPELDLGVHLTLNAEWDHYRWGPVAGRSAVPSLLDDRGYLPRTSLEVVQRAKPEEVAVELRAQVRKALDAGIDVTHLDSHMGTCFFPPFLQIYADLAREFGVPIFAARPDAEALEKRGMSAVAKILDSLVGGLTADGIPVLDGFDAESLEFAVGQGQPHNEARLDGLVQGLNYVICHPAQGGEELDVVCPESAHQRDFERSFYGGEPGRAALAERGIKTVGMRAIRDLMHS
jgi:predicted glycoside hydrolase/deacetylase ChbG (UPF0249 family)